MTARTFAIVCGVFYLVIGICGFIPSLSQLQFSTDIAYTMGTGMNTTLLFSTLPITTASNILNLGIGLAGLLAAGSAVRSEKYAAVMSGLAGTLLILGILPLGINTLWGFLPLSGWNIGLHIITAVIAFYFGFVFNFRAESQPA